MCLDRTRERENKKDNNWADAWPFHSTRSVGQYTDKTRRQDADWHRKRE